MTHFKGRLWKHDSEGFILNDADATHLQPPFSIPIDKARSEYIRILGNSLHSIYVTGSVSRGLAVQGKSDLDLFAVLRPGSENSDDTSIVDASRGVHRRFPWLSDVQMEVWRWDYAFAPQSPFSIGSFIIKTHSICIYGDDLAPRIPRFKPSAHVAADDIAQIKPDIEEAISEINKDPGAENVSYCCKRIMKNIVRTGFALVMLEEKSHTRDLDLCCEIFSKYFPEKKLNMERAVELSLHSLTSRDELLAFINSFGNWIMAQADTWLLEHRRH